MEKARVKLPNNVPGRYYVSEKCDGCAYCAGVAPENFGFDKPSNTYFIGRQPDTDEEIELVLEAMEDCPVDAIISMVVSCPSAMALN
ncbi:MAG TPA: ferredoxin [Bacteroidetes bacterium]|nr:ferredoxin [Bacteroidota bacterium]